MNADDEIRNGGLSDDDEASELPAGERDIGPDEPGGTEPPPPALAESELLGLDDQAVMATAIAPDFVAEAGTADIGMPDEDAADELVGDDMDAAEWAALDGPTHVEDQAVADAPETLEAARLTESEWEDVEALLQLVNALSLSPEVAATVTSGVAALGALVAGYLTPDRAPVLPPAPQSVAASPLDVALIPPLPAPPVRRPARRPVAHQRPSGHA